MIDGAARCARRGVEVRPSRGQPLALVSARKDLATPTLQCRCLTVSWTRCVGRFRMYSELDALHLTVS